MFSFASMTIAMMLGRPAMAHQASGSLPSLAGSATVATPSYYASAASRTNTIPLLQGIGDNSESGSGGAAGNGSEISGPQSLTKSLNVGESEVFQFDHISTSAVGDPTVADIAPLNSNQLLISAKGVGHTTIFVFDSHGKNVISMTVLPSTNMDVIAERVEDEIGIPTITVRAINDWLFLEGAAPDESASDLANSIAQAYTSKVKNLIVVGVIKPLTEAENYANLVNENLNPAGITARAFDASTIILTGKYATPINTNAFSSTEYGNAEQEVATQVDPLKQLLASLPPDLRVVNLINFSKEQAKQILVRAKIIDIDRNSTKNLGVNWGTVTGTPGPDNTVITTFSPQPILFGQMQSAIPVAGSLGSILGGGPLSRVSAWGGELNALITEGKARVLSEPSLLVLDGNAGSMLVGGEYPIPVLQSSSTGNAITVQFKPYGIQLAVWPTIVGDDTVQLRVTPTVSNLDFSNGVNLNGFVIPGLDDRTATTTLQMKDGQTLVIGGLYDNEDTKNINKIPLISQIPVLGEFFKSTSTSKIERELLVLLSAEIVTPDSLGATPPPADSLENLSIHKPYIPRKEYDEQFPDITNGPGHVDAEAPKVPIAMPNTGGTDAGK